MRDKGETAKAINVSLAFNSISKLLNVSQRALGHVNYNMLYVVSFALVSFNTSIFPALQGKLISNKCLHLNNRIE